MKRAEVTTGTSDHKALEYEFNAQRPGSFCEYRDYQSRFRAAATGIRYTHTYGGASKIWHCRKCDAWHMENPDREFGFNLVSKGDRYAGTIGTSYADR